MSFTGCTRPAQGIAIYEHKHVGLIAMYTHCSRYKNGTVRVGNLSKSEPFAIFKHHTMMCRSVDFDPTGQYLLTSACPLIYLNVDQYIIRAGGGIRQILYRSLRTTIGHISTVLRIPASLPLKQFLVFSRGTVLAEQRPLVGRRSCCRVK